MLTIQNLSASYDASEVLHDVSLSVREGEFVAVIGANTAGKSTLLRSISRLVPRTLGRIEFDGQDLSRLQAHQVSALGIGHVPEGRHVFPEMTVEENLVLGAYSVRKKVDWPACRQRVYELFPRLEERRHQRAGTLSGGEQQMVAVGRALMLNPRLLLLDEPSHGLAPIVVDELHHALVNIHRSGVSILLVEQNTRLALSVAARGYVLQAGSVFLEGESGALMRDERVREAYLGI